MRSVGTGKTPNQAKSFLTHPSGCILSAIATDGYDKNDDDDDALSSRSALIINNDAPVSFTCTSFSAAPEVDAQAPPIPDLAAVNAVNPALMILQISMNNIKNLFANLEGVEAKYGSLDGPGEDFSAFYSPASSARARPAPAAASPSAAYQLANLFGSGPVHIKSSSSRIMHVCNVEREG